jgi:hypothetical protein
MVAEIEMKVYISSKTDKAVKCIFHEDQPEETEVWVPLSVIDDTEPLDNLDPDGCCNIVIKKWFLIKNDVSYESETEATDTKFRK